MVDAGRIIEGVMGGRYFEDDISIDSARCVAARSRKLTCRQCVEICPTGAIAIAPRRVEVNRDVCTHCGACVTVCPTQAVASGWQPWKGLLAGVVATIAPTDGHPVIACEKAADVPRDRRKVARVECLECVDESLLLAVLASGARDVRLAAGDCATCGTGCMGAVWTLVADYTNDMLAAIGVESRRILCFLNPASLGHTSGNSSGASELGCGPDSENVAPTSASCGGSVGDDGLDGEGVTRRDLFGGFRGRASKAVEGIASGLAEDARYRTIAGVLGFDTAEGTSPLDGASRGQICAWALAELAEREGRGSLAGVIVPSRIFSDIEIDADACSKCFLCVAYCQTKAIEKQMDGHRAVGLITHPLLCNQCRACIDICKPQAITLTRMVQALRE